METKRVKWTSEQRQAIETVGRSLLVSAAAGSGKTAVLAERCAHLVCDAPEPHRCDVDQLLVVTFTNAAANEMRERIGNALRERLARDGEPDSRLQRQMALLDRASISTLHGFCSSLLRQHFNVLGIDPNVSTLAQDEAILLRNEVARELFVDRYASDESGEFQRFVDDYGDGDDRALIRQVLRTHDLLCSMVDREDWIETAQARIAEASEKPIIESAMGKALLQFIKQSLRDYYARCRHAADQLSRMPGFEDYVAIVSEIMAMIEVCGGSSDLDEIGRRICEFQSGKLRPISEDTPGKERAKKLLNSIRKEVKEGRLYQLARFTSAEWRDSARRIASPCSVFLKLVEDFEKRYRAEKDELRAVDFSDLERHTLRILCDGDLTKPSAVAKLCRAQFRHVLVDEYQDINAVQDAILALVSNEANLFCVGDVKQSIYGFRLAEPARFLQRDQRFRKGDGGQVIDLQKNFRGRAPLLDSINALFRRAMTSNATGIAYDTSHALAAGADYPRSSDKSCFTGAPVEVHLLPAAPRGGSSDESDDADSAEADRTEREAAFVAHRIHQLLGHDGSPPMQVCVKEHGKLVLQPIQPKHIVLLLRSMKMKSDDFAEQLRLRGIPVHSDSATGFFQAMEVRDILALLRLLDNQRQDVPMAAVLRSPLSGLPNVDDCLARIRLAYPDDRGAVPFHQAAGRYATEKRDDLAAALREFFQQLHSWREAAHRRPLAELLWQIYDQTGYLAFCAGLESGQQRVANLIALHERAREFGTFQRQGLGRFMEFLKTLQEESDLGQPSIASEADDVVRIMSIHRAKGLEFPVVFIADLGKQHNMQDSSGAILADRDAYLGLEAGDEEKRIRYPSIASTLVQDRLRRQTLAEELRVLYVAMTRAKEHLILVGTCPPDSEEKWRESWREHRGPLPAHQVLGASTMLDWIGPACAAIASENSNAFTVQSYTDEQVEEWVKESARPREFNLKQRARADLIPLSPAPATDPLAQTVLDRVVAPYQFAAFTKLPATASVTSLTKKERAAHPSDVRHFDEFRTELALPAFISPAVAAPTEVGLTTHLVLQHLDFATARTAEEVSKQVKQMIARKLLLDESARSVNIPAIVWLVQSELGELLRANASQLYRELPIYFAQEATSRSGKGDPLDRVMVRGRIDVLISTERGLILADYKTDRITEAAVDSRMQLYRPQMHEYRRAIARITGQPVCCAYLAFLEPKILRRID